MEINILEYVKQKMAELGYSKYAVIPFYKKDLANVLFQIDAGNEYYFLTSKHSFATMLIATDNDRWTTQSFADYQNMTVYNLQMFTGKITVFQNPGINIEFLRVIPIKDDAEQKTELLTEKK